MSTPFEPIRIGSIELENRLAMAPIKTAYGTKDGRVTERLVAYFRRRAEGGAGLIISEPLYVDRRGREHPKQTGIDSDDKLGGLSDLTGEIHKAGSRVFAHLNHGGRAANPKASGGPPEAPSNVVCTRTGLEPEVLSTERIADLVAAFADAGVRAVDAGFDGVELQFGMGYLVSQFLSQKTNLRSDAHGGDVEGRTRFAREVFSAVRDAVGEQFPIGVRISGSEKTPGGLDIEDALDLARRLESWGADMIHVASGSSCDSPPWYFQHMALPNGVNETLASGIKNGIDLPVMVAGRMGEPSRIREVLDNGMIDMVALGRPLLADPDLPKEMMEGRDDEVLICGSCLQGCLGRIMSGQDIGCNINPELGREADVIEPASTPRRVIVVGGGPAGLQTALTAQRRGHHVTLFEKDRLGGQFTLASRAPGKEKLGRSLGSMIARVERSGIEIRLGDEATLDKLVALEPDVVMLATGSRPALPEVPGLDGPVTGEDVLASSCEIGDRVLILGGGMVGMEVAEFLAGKGRQCAVVEVLDEVGKDMVPINRKLMMKRLESLPVEIHTGTGLVRVDGRDVVVERGGEQRVLGKFDDVVIAVGNQSFDPLSEALRKEGIHVEVIGDAEKPARVYDAVDSGHKAAMAV